MSKTSIEWLPDAGLADCRSSGDTMGTRWSARFHAPAGTDVKAVAAALERAVTAVDRQMSNWQAGSDLSRLNRAAPGVWLPVPAELALVLARALEIGRETGNAFNIGVGALVDAWGFGPAGQAALHGRPGEPAPQRHAPLDALLEIDGPGGRVRKHGELALDLCGIAKGFGVDELARVLDAHGLGSWLVGIDGEMRARGTKPGGAPWAIALEAPAPGRRAALGVIELGDAAVATSGDYRHWREVAGRRVSHTMDPRTGAPLSGTIASVTVVAPRCMDADAYATALMVLGEQGGCALAQRLGLDAFMVVREGAGWRARGSGCFGAAGATAGADTPASRSPAPAVR